MSRFQLDAEATSWTPPTETAEPYSLASLSLPSIADSPSRQDSTLFAILNIGSKILIDGPDGIRLCFALEISPFSDEAAGSASTYPDEKF